VALLTAVLGTTHHPFYYALTNRPPEQSIPQAPEWKRKVEAYRETLTRAKPDLLVMVAGIQIGLFGPSTLTLGVGAPVTGPRLFDVEGIAQLNFRF